MFAIGGKYAYERQPQIALCPRDEHRRSKIDRCQRQAAGPRQHRTASAVIVRDKDRVADAGLLTGYPSADDRRRNRPRVDRLDRRGEEIGALEKERPLFGKEERKALVRG